MRGDYGQAMTQNSVELAVIRAWIDADPDPVTRDELKKLVVTMPDSISELADRFAGRLQFGTAGLRGAVGAGPNRMNRLVVRQAAAGLMDWLPGGAKVVIGYDARTTSEAFAIETARVVEAKGGTAVLGNGFVPTPALAFAVTNHEADAGVMVTASHNPAGDNGYKVYLNDGAQLVSPADTEIEEAISIVAANGFDPGEPYLADPVDFLTPYIDAMHAVLGASVPGARPLKVVYSAMHGVGSEGIHKLFGRLGLDELIVVPEQDEPDGTFPTAPFPNPEEAGALDLAFALAKEVEADFVIANDPDADRLALAVNGPTGWGRLTGDQLGLLLADSVLDHTDGDDRIVASSLVSSSSLGVLAAARGVAYQSTLTGFKWIVKVGRPGSGKRLVFGYEEALGYCVSTKVLDKDGISAAAELVRRAQELSMVGSDLPGRLAEIFAEIGVFVTDQHVERVEGSGAQEKLTAIMASLRSDPPTTIGSRVISVEDLLGDVDKDADVLTYRLEDGSRIILRPSGTEPKLKAYLEATAPPTGDVAQVAAVEIELQQRLDKLKGSVAELIGNRT